MVLYGPNMPYNACFHPLEASRHQIRPLHHQKIARNRLYAQNSKLASIKFPKGGTVRCMSQPDNADID